MSSISRWFFMVTPISPKREKWRHFQTRPPIHALSIAVVSSWAWDHGLIPSWSMNKPVTFSVFNPVGQIRSDSRKM
jgi:hypothetical protein